ncbi:MAG: DUF58 domain-containing protein [Chitinophagaceae bacterium]|nr:DUF58 domain-containing protein [Chitinophagaceae bacterium]
MENTAHIEHLSLLANQVVEGFIIGLHKSPFHGFSVEFAEHRLYNTGDNIKHIDWKVYGRTDKLFIKKYEEETNLRCQIIIDTSSSMLFPENAAHYNKLQFSCLAAASLINLLKRQLDAVGLSLFNDDLYYHSKCRSNTVHFSKLNTELERLLKFDEKNKSSHNSKILHQIAENIHRRSLVVIFSDMMDRLDDENNIFDAIQHLKYNKHEVILFHVTDKKLEIDFDFENRPMEFIDMESGERIKMNSNALKKTYQEEMRKRKDNLALKCGQFNVDIIDADINLGMEQILLPYLIKRNKMK